MGFRRNGLRDERRRRVLIDETLHAADSPAENDVAGVVRTPAKPYTDAAIASSQLPITFFLPKRPIITWAVWLVGMTLVAGIELLYRYAYLGSPSELRTSLSALDVTQRGSIAGWLAGVLLAVSAFASLLVYQIRRHRTDDYRGRYRWWLWLVPMLLLVSVTASTGLHEGLSGSLTALTGAQVALGGKGWWLLAYGAVFFPVVLQIGLEVRTSRLASFFFASTVAAYVAVAMFELGALQLNDPVASTICHSALLLTAHLGVLVSVLAYGRYVYLDAHSRLAARKTWLRLPKRRQKKVEKTAATGKKSAGKTTQVRMDEAHAQFGQENAAPSSASIKADTSQPDESDLAPDRKLSKAERRRLRKEVRDE